MSDNPEDLKKYFPFTLTVDGKEIRLRLARLVFDETFYFKDGLEDVLRSPIERLVAREASGPEQERDAKGEYAISWEAICIRRRPTLSSTQHAELEELEKAHEHRARVFVKDVFSRFVAIERGPVVEGADGTTASVTSGLEFLNLYAMRDQDVWLPVLMAIHSENTLDARQKKALRSPAASPRTSSGRKGPGRRRGTIAAAAATEASAGTAGAPATPAGPSGSTASSS
jgi:hypothetical protein